MDNGDSTNKGESEREPDLSKGFVKSRASVWNILKLLRGSVKRQLHIQIRNTEDVSRLEILTCQSMYKAKDRHNINEERRQSQRPTW